MPAAFSRAVPPRTAASYLHDPLRLSTGIARTGARSLSGVGRRSTAGHLLEVLKNPFAEPEAHGGTWLKKPREAHRSHRSRVEDRTFFSTLLEPLSTLLSRRRSTRRQWRGTARTQHALAARALVTVSVVPAPRAMLAERDRGADAPPGGGRSDRESASPAASSAGGDDQCQLRERSAATRSRGPPASARRRRRALATRAPGHRSRATRAHVVAQHVRGPSQIGSTLRVRAGEDRQPRVLHVGRPRLHAFERLRRDSPPSCFAVGQLRERVWSRRRARSRGGAPCSRRRGAARRVER
jgi:hypothetical protein